MGRFLAPHRHLLALLALRRTIRSVRPDVVHGHSSIGGAMARLATLGTALPTVYTPHALARSRWALAVERLLGGRTARLIAVSDSEREFAIARRVTSPDRAVTIPNGVDPEPPPAPPRGLRDSIGIGPHVPLVGCVARLTWQKAPEVFVSACALVADQMPEAHFVLIGAGALLGQVTAAVRDTGIERRFHLIPSFANAAGAPVVVTNVPGNRDVVEDGVNGLVVPPEDPRSLAEAIVRVMTDDALRSVLIHSAIQRVARYDARSMAATTAGLYRDLCDQPVRAAHEAGVMVTP
jgi:glycosyltransferase involved in cell wall biosynthesis